MDTAVCTTELRSLVWTAWENRFKKTKWLIGGLGIDWEEEYTKKNSERNHCCSRIAVTFFPTESQCMKAVIKSLLHVL